MSKIFYLVKIVMFVFVLSGCGGGSGSTGGSDPSPPEEPSEPQGNSLPTLDVSSGFIVSRSTGDQGYRTAHGLGAALSAHVQTGKNYESRPRGAIIPRDEK